MKLSIDMPDLSDWARVGKADLAAASSAAMRETTPTAKQALREQIVSAGLGARLANTWRGEVYPKNRSSIEAAGYIYSRAPAIVDAFARGATIVPVAGSKYLAIPTDAVPRSRGRRGATRRMTPLEVEAHFNQDLFFQRGKGGHVLAFLTIVGARRGRGYRPNTALRRSRRGVEAQRVLMFTLVPTVRMPKLLDLEAVSRRWADDYVAALGRRLEDV